MIDVHNEEALVEFCFIHCRNNPLLFVEHMYPWNEQGSELEGVEGPDKWQREFLQNLGRALEYHEFGDGLDEELNSKGLRFATVSGHGIGKTALTSWLVHWHGSCRPFSSGVVTANTGVQLTDKTWKELSKWVDMGKNSHWFNKNTKKIRMVQHPDKWFISCVSWDISKPEATAGLHGNETIIIYDEASAIPDIIWETAEGVMTDKNAMWFVFGNPTRNTGRFRECFRDFEHRWHQMQVDSRDAIRTDKSQIKQWEEDYGVDSDFFKVRVRGIFPSASSMQLIPSHIVEAAQEREYTFKDFMNEPKIIGLDTSRSGDDETVVVFRQGRIATVLDAWREIDQITLAERIARIIDSRDIDKCFMDLTGGYGTSVYDQLVKMGLGRKVTGVIFNNSPADPRKYYNKRAEMWGLMGEWLKNADIPKDDKALSKDLISVEYSYRGGDGHRLILETKEDLRKRLGRSPDRGDALALTFAYPVNINKDKFGRSSSGIRTEVQNNLRKMY